MKTFIQMVSLSDRNLFKKPIENTIPGLYGARPSSGDTPESFCYPIMPLLRDNSFPQEPVQMIALTNPLHSAYKPNFDVLLEEARAIRPDIRIIELPINEDEVADTYRALIVRLTELIGPEDDLFVDITFGSAPTKVALTLTAMLMRSIKQANIRCVSYLGVFGKSDAKGATEVKPLRDCAFMLDIVDLATQLSSGGLSVEEKTDILMHTPWL